MHYIVQSHVLDLSHVAEDCFTLVSILSCHDVESLFFLFLLQNLFGMEGDCQC